MMRRYLLLVRLMRRSTDMTNQECINILQQMANKEKNNETPEFRALIHAIRLCKMMECKDLADTCRNCGGCFVDWNWRNASH